MDRKPKQDKEDCFTSIMDIDREVMVLSKELHKYELLPQVDTLCNVVQGLQGEWKTNMSLSGKSTKSRDLVLLLLHIAPW